MKKEYLLVLYSFLVPINDLLKSLTSVPIFILILIYVLLSANNVIIRRSNVVLAITILFFSALSFLGSLRYGFDFLDNWLSMILYFPVVVSFMFLKLNPKYILMCFSGFLMSFVIVLFISILDHFSILSVPGANQGLSGFDVDGFRFNDMTAIYQTRSYLGMYISIILPFPILYILNGRKSKWITLYLLVANILVFVSVFLSNSRGVLLSYFFVLLYLFYQYNVKNFLKTIFFIIIVFEFAYKLGFLESMIARLNLDSQSDESIRQLIHKNALNEIVKNFWGSGFSNVYIEEIKMFYNPHSNVLQFFRAGGILGIACLIYLFLNYLKVVKRNIFSSNKQLPTQVLILSFLSVNIYGITHTTTGFMFYWLIYGMTYSIANYDYSKYYA